MSVKLRYEKDVNVIPVYDMKDGQIGEIVNWVVCMSKYKGLIVQRFGNILIVIGEEADLAFDTSLLHRREENRVRLLHPGELIEIISN